jgi:hypothetical protein
MPAVAPTPKQDMAVQEVEPVPSRSRCLLSLRAIHGLWSRKRRNTCQSPNRLHRMTSSPSLRLSLFLPRPRYRQALSQPRHTG